MILLLIDMQPTFYASYKILNFWEYNIKLFSYTIFIQTKSNVVDCGPIFPQLINNANKYKIITKKSDDGSKKLINLLKHKKEIYFGGVNASKCVQSTVSSLIHQLPYTKFIHVHNGTADLICNDANQLVLNYCKYSIVLP